MHPDDPPRPGQGGEQRRDRTDARANARGAAGERDPAGGSATASSDGGTRRRTVLRASGGGVAFGTVGTLGAEVSTATGVDRSSPSVRSNVRQNGASTLDIEEVRPE